MVRRGFFSHVTPRGAALSTGCVAVATSARTTPGTRARRRLGQRPSATPAVIVAEWIASPPHRRILLGRDFREVGVGVAAGAPQPTTGGRRSVTYTLNTGAIGG